MRTFGYLPGMCAMLVTAKSRARIGIMRKLTITHLYLEQVYYSKEK
jgi:hypothetical protein